MTGSGEVGFSAISCNSKKHGSDERTVLFLYHRKLRKFDLAVLYCLNTG